MSAKSNQHDTELAETMEAIREDMRRFKADIKTLVKDLGQAGKEGVATAGEYLRNGAEQGVEGVREKLSKVKDMGAEKMKSADETVKAHPYMTAAVALGVGALLGRFFRRA